jgi:two-component system, OmpR family, copper resistance phosphate regulon response regulator CusR
VKVLVVEDYAPLRNAVCQGLTEAGYVVESAEDGQQAMWRVKSFEYDVVLLDLMIPHVDGLSVLSYIRDSGREANVLVVTAKDSLDDRVTGLNLGADDYLVKPFEYAELLARVQALVRRKYGVKSPIIRIDDLEIDMTRRRACRNGEHIELTAREYALLEYLAHRAGQVVTRTEIWEHVYDFNSSAHSNVVDVYIGYLRKKIEREGTPRLIHTRRGHGYVLGIDE